MASYRRLRPKTPIDTFAFYFTLFGINAIYYYELLVVLPWITAKRDEPNTILWYTHVALGTLFYINALGSFWKVIGTETSTAGVMLPSILKEGWRFCSICEANAPPRSFHCHDCKKCILKRDHHCVFTGNCIGYRNHRYYLMLVFYCAGAATYASIVNVDYMWNMVGGLTLWSPLKVLFPLFSWLLGFLPFSNMLTTALLLLCIAVMLSVNALLGYHLRNLYYGQITHEHARKVFKYNISLKENIRGVFGNNWHVAWMSPWIPSELPGDGLSFMLASEYEDPKHI